MKKPEEKEYYLNTGCAMEVIRLGEYYDMDSYKTPTKVIGWSLALSLLTYMHSQVWWRQQLRHIWRIITTGSPWKDEVILDLKSAKELRDKLNEMIKKADKLTKEKK